MNKQEIERLFKLPDDELYKVIGINIANENKASYVDECFMESYNKTQEPTIIYETVPRYHRKKHSIKPTTRIRKAKKIRKEKVIIIGKQTIQQNQHKLQEIVCNNVQVIKFILTPNDDIFGLIGGITSLIACVFPNPATATAASILIIRHGIRLFCKNYLPK